mmetsp:Transcript_3195/g.19755  ORF Transcript_3195/g.19755 Transcript_3195/m.19755 type:complete len:138 (-) Transcript_3195:861-1274(-)
MGRVHDFFDQCGLEPRDLPLAFVLHEVVSVALATAAWSFCYAAQPSQIVARSIPRATTTSAWMQRTTAAAEAKLQWTKRLPLAKKNGKRLAVSLAESIALRAAIKPITFPGKMWASWKLTLLLKRKQPQDSLGNVKS